jgi:hypothetical protein
VFAIDEELKSIPLALAGMTMRIGPSTTSKPEPGPERSRTPFLASSWSFKRCWLQLLYLRNISHRMFVVERNKGGGEEWKVIKVQKWGRGKE